jgi:phosphoheptose isomerase
METKHTQGKWKIWEDWICTEEGDDIARIDGNDKEAQANAKLIAAAPDLLKALKKCSKVLSMYNSDKSVDAWYLAEQAIKKATS